MKEKLLELVKELEWDIENIRNMADYEFESESYDIEIGGIEYVIEKIRKFVRMEL